MHPDGVTSPSRVQKIDRHRFNHQRPAISSSVDSLSAGRTHREHSWGQGAFHVGHALPAAGRGCLTS
jgi:hypothetical protein